MSNLNIDTTAIRLPYAATLHVRDHCLCLATQRAARALARRFDEALRPFGLTNGQFSLLMALNRPDEVSMGPLATFLGMDRTTLTAALKPLEREGLITIAPDPKDRRGRKITLTADGHARLIAALPIWQATHGEVDARLSLSPAELRTGLRELA